MLGCIVCKNTHGQYREPDIHHLTESCRLGHDFTIPLCPWHHRAVPPNNVRMSVAVEILGPSLAANKSAFVAAYGTERELLATVDDLLKGVEI